MQEILVENDSGLGNQLQQYPWTDYADPGVYRIRGEGNHIYDRSTDLVKELTSREVGYRIIKFQDCGLVKDEVVADLQAYVYAVFVVYPKDRGPEVQLVRSMGKLR